MMITSFDPDPLEHHLKSMPESHSECNLDGTRKDRLEGKTEDPLYNIHCCKTGNISDNIQLLYSNLTIQSPSRLLLR